MAFSVWSAFVVDCVIPDSRNLASACLNHVPGVVVVSGGSFIATAAVVTIHCCVDYCVDCCVVFFSSFSSPILNVGVTTVTNDSGYTQQVILFQTHSARPGTNCHGRITRIANSTQ